MVIGVGTRYTDFTTASKWLFREDAKFININVSEFQAMKLDALPVLDLTSIRILAMRIKS